MSLVKDAVVAMKEVLLLTEKVEQTASTLSEITKELKDQNGRIIRLETLVEIGQRQISDK